MLKILARAFKLRQHVENVCKSFCFHLRLDKKQTIFPSLVVSTLLDKVHGNP